MMRILIPIPLRYRLCKRKIKALQPRLERLNRIPVWRMGIRFTRSILEIPMCQPSVRIVSTLYTVRAMGAAYNMRVEGVMRPMCAV
jgi:hypothetical protein